MLSLPCVPCCGSSASGSLASGAWGARWGSSGALLPFSSSPALAVWCPPGSLASLAGPSPASWVSASLLPGASVPAPVLGSSAVVLLGGLPFVVVWSPAPARWVLSASASPLRACLGSPLFASFLCCGVRGVPAAWSLAALSVLVSG